MCDNLISEELFKNELLFCFTEQKCKLNRTSKMTCMFKKRKLFTEKGTLFSVNTENGVVVFFTLSYFYDLVSDILYSCNDILQAFNTQNTHVPLQYVH